ncbi:protein eva-1-like C-like isoform X1, partial [Silurus asotus]
LLLCSCFLAYLLHVLRNYTDEVCDGDLLTVRCPPRTTITVQSAFYGRRSSAHSLLCPMPYSMTGPRPLSGVPACHVSTALQKMTDECEDRRSCELLVNSRLFGTDPCPSISKSLNLQYKCQPNEFKSKVVCEGEKLRVTCKTGMQIAVFSAMFGRTQEGALECPPHPRRMPSVDCRAEGALQVMTSRCQGKRMCMVQVSVQEFGDPCYTGTRKYLSVIYTCVPSASHAMMPCQFPKKLLQDSVQTPPSSPPRDPNVVGDSSPSEGNQSVTSDPAPDSHRYISMKEHPERCALYFMCGVCVGLFLTLFALVVQISCRTECKQHQAVAKKRPRQADSDSDSDSDSDWDSGSDLSSRRRRRFERTLNTNVFTSAEELERAQRLEERERIIREIWMNGQPDVPGTRSLNRY